MPQLFELHQGQFVTYEEKVRARCAVRRAARLATGGARRWLVADERGLWETLAHELWESANRNPLRVGMSDDEIEGQVSLFLAEQAVKLLNGGQA